MSVVESLLEIFGDYLAADRLADWERAKADLPKGKRVTGKVVLRSPFGVWLDLGVGFPALLEIILIDGLTPEKYRQDDYGLLGTTVLANVFSFSDDARQICLSQTMVPKGEQRICNMLRPILLALRNGEAIPDSEQFRAVLSGLEFFVPKVLGEIYSEWKYESLDGIYPLEARKVGCNEAEIFGLCIIISDQTTTPIHLRFQVSESADEVSWMECRLGERGEHGMLRTKWSSVTETKHLPALNGRKTMIDWVYKVTFGQRKEYAHE